MANRNRTGTDEIDELMHYIKTLMVGIQNAKARQQKDLITNKEWYEIRNKAFKNIEDEIRRWNKP